MLIKAELKHEFNKTFKYVWESEALAHGGFFFINFIDLSSSSTCIVMVFVCVCSEHLLLQQKSFVFKARFKGNYSRTYTYVLKASSLTFFLYF